MAKLDSLMYLKAGCGRWGVPRSRLGHREDSELVSCLLEKNPSWGENPKFPDSGNLHTFYRSPLGVGAGEGVVGVGFIKPALKPDGSPDEEAMRIWATSASKVLDLLEYQTPESIPSINKIIICQELPLEDVSILSGVRACVLFDSTGKVLSPKSLLSPPQVIFGDESLMFSGNLTEKTIRAFAYSRLVRACCLDGVLAAVAGEVQDGGNVNPVGFVSEKLMPKVLTRKDKTILRRAWDEVSGPFKAAESAYVVLKNKNIREVPAVDVVRKKVIECLALWREYAEESPNFPVGIFPHDWESVSISMGLDTAFEAYAAGVPYEMLCLGRAKS